MLITLLNMAFNPKNLYIKANNKFNNTIKKKCLIVKKVMIVRLNKN